MTGNSLQEPGEFLPPALVEQAVGEDEELSSSDRLSYFPWLTITEVLLSLPVSFCPLTPTRTDISADTPLPGKVQSPL